VHFSNRRLASFLFLATAQAIFLLLLVFVPYYRAIINDDGQTEDLTTIGTVMYAAAVFAVLLQIFNEAKSVNLIFILSFAISAAFLFIYLLFVSLLTFPDYSMIGVLTSIFGAPVSVISIFIPPLFCYAIGFTLSALFEVTRPSPTSQINLGNSIAMCRWNP
jgi:hypothetical protein